MERKRSNYECGLPILNGNSEKYIFAGGFTPLEKAPDGVGGEYHGEDSGLKPSSSITAGPVLPRKRPKAERGLPSNVVRGRSFLTGFTFVEMITVLVIVSVVFGAVLYFLFITKDSLAIGNAKISLQQDLRRCITKMVEELSESSINYVKSEDGDNLNMIQRDDVEGILKCVPLDEECVYYTVKFKKPTSWDSQGEIDGWSDYITYTLSSEAITRQEGSNPAVNLVSNMSLVVKSSGHNHTYDPNSLGSGVERLANNRIKISLVAERKFQGRTVRVDAGSIVYLRN